MKSKIIEIKKRAEKQLKEWNYPNEHYIEAKGALMVCNELLEQPDKDSIPFTCPVCGGNGLVPNGFYHQTGEHWSTTSTTPEKCQSCNGTGVVWKVE